MTIASSRRSIPRTPWSHGTTVTFLVALLLLPTLVGPGVTDARAQRVLFDFEGPFVLDEGRTIKDHTLVFDADTQSWHVFYIRGVVGTPGTSSEKELGHAVSDNLRSWSIFPSVLFSDPGTFDSRNVWAPEVLRNETNDGWTMYYTGVDSRALQRTGRADSSNLYDWVELPANPILEPDSTVYLWSPDLPVPSLSAFRDPFFFEADGKFHLLHSALVPDSTVNEGRRGVVHHLESVDRQNWVDVGPIASNNGNSGWWREIESVQLIENDGVWTMFFTYFGIQGVQYIQSAQYDSGWDFRQATPIDFGIGGEFHPLGNGSWIFTRHIPLVHQPFHPSGGEIFFTLRADTLRFDPGTGEPEIFLTDPLAEDWIERTGTAFLAAPTFGDNQLERGELPVSATGHGYVSTREFYNGPLGGVGALGAQLGGSPVGTMTSRWFTIEPNDSLLSFQLGGTDIPECRVELVRRVSTAPEVLEVVRTAVPTGVDRLITTWWDVRDLRGAEVRVVIRDESVDGYIAVDHFRTWAEPAVATAAPSASRPLAAIERIAPNPFNPRTEIRFRLDVDAEVRLLLHDLRGRRIREFDLGALDAGSHAQVWDGADDAGQSVASGVYLVRLLTDGAVGEGRKVTLVR